MLDKTAAVIKKAQSRYSGKIGYATHKINKIQNKTQSTKGMSNTDLIKSWR
jgi:hypothetical protein